MKKIKLQTIRKGIEKPTGVRNVFFFFEEEEEEEDTFI